MYLPAWVVLLLSLLALVGLGTISRAFMPPCPTCRQKHAPGERCR